MHMTIQEESVHFDNDGSKSHELLKLEELAMALCWICWSSFIKYVNILGEDSVELKVSILGSFILA